MIALFNKLVADGLTPHVAWRASFALVPVPVLLSVAAATLVFGTDHPAGRWSDRHQAIAAELGGTIKEDQEHASSYESKKDAEKKDGSAEVEVTVAAVQDFSSCVFLSATAAFLRETFRRQCFQTRCRG
jgi:NNP family nitrate/nitrite transporter-like MFS transporter